MQVSFTDTALLKKDNKKAPKFRVENKGDTDRIVIISPPELYYVHGINMPVIDPQTGEKIMETRENPSNGNTWEVPKEEFVSEMMCSGNPKVVSEADGVDPDGCTICAAYVENPGKFKKPVPKYACVVARYKTAFEETTPQLDPVQAEILVWVLTQKRFEKIFAIAKEYGDPVGKLDLLCGPCKNVKMHNYEIAAAGKCAYKESEEVQEFVARALKSSGITNDVIKSTVAYAQTEVSVKMAISKVLERYALEGHGAVGGGAVDVEFNALAADSHKAAESASGDSPWGAVSSPVASAPDFVEKPAEAAVPAPKAEEAPAPAPATESKPVSLDDILAGLG